MTTQPKVKTQVQSIPTRFGYTVKVGGLTNVGCKTNKK